MQLPLDFAPEPTRVCAHCGARYRYDAASWPEHCRDWCRMQATGQDLATVLRGMPEARADRVFEGAAWWLQEELKPKQRRRSNAKHV